MKLLLMPCKTGGMLGLTSVCCVQPSVLTRRPTVVEGLYSGLGSGAALTVTQLDIKMKLLVEAPAAVEDALASLLDHHDATLQVLDPVSTFSSGKFLSGCSECVKDGEGAVLLD